MGCWLRRNKQDNRNDWRDLWNELIAARSRNLHKWPKFSVQSSSGTCPWPSQHLLHDAKYHLGALYQFHLSPENLEALGVYKYTHLTQAQNPHRIWATSSLAAEKDRQSSDRPVLPHGWPSQRLLRGHGSYPARITCAWVSSNVAFSIPRISIRAATSRADKSPARSLYTCPAIKLVGECDPPRLDDVHTEPVGN